jgi:hypothetical protein
MEFVFITKIIPTPKKWCNVGDTFGVLFPIQMIQHKLLWEGGRRLEMPMKKIKNFICFEMLEED